MSAIDDIVTERYHYTNMARAIITKAVGGYQSEWSEFDHAIMNMARDADAEVERLRAEKQATERHAEGMIRAARALCGNIRDHGVHDNWKELSNLLDGHHENT